MFFRRWRLNRRTLGLAGAGGGVATIYYYSNLEETPITGRKRFLSISKKREQQLSALSYQKILQENQGLLRRSVRVERIVRRLLGAVDPAWNLAAAAAEWDWRVHVIESDKEKNAFVLPGGQIFVYTGLLKMFEDDDSSLATILGHEIGHVLVRHGAEKTSMLYFTESILAIGYQIITGGAGIGGGGGEMFIIDLLKDLLITLPFSRRCESEADWIGIQLMKRSSFDVSKALDVWRKMDSSSTPKILSTHPSNEERIEKIKEWIM